MKLTQLTITDDLPLVINLCGKSLWAIDDNKKIHVERLLERKEENYTITAIICAGIKPSEDAQKITDTLHYFFQVCDPGMSPQSLWGDENCAYRSLLLDYQKEQSFDQVFAEITKRFPELRNPENLLEKIPEGKRLIDVVSTIEIAFPSTWNVDYER